MTDSIPATKSKSKIKPLKEKIQTLEYKYEDLLEECYKNGTRIRPTIMTQIEEKEKETLSQLNFVINECEKKTGRILKIAVNPHDADTLYLLHNN